ncbi:MAG: hypothetical protein JKY45_02450 [Emcibacter sp.]|nr:hypothetical protein [Emcibacter sp.]
MFDVIVRFQIIGVGLIFFLSEAGAVANAAESLGSDAIISQLSYRIGNGEES